MRRVYVAVVTIVFLVGESLAAEASSGQRTLAEHLLEILRSEQVISEERYQELRELAEKERQALADVAAAARNPDIDFGWKDGIYLEARKQGFKLQMGGRVHNDWALFSEDSSVEDVFGEIGSGTEFRRARIYLKGQVAENVRFKFEYDFAEGDADFKDVYIQLGDIPLVDWIKVGHFKEPFSLEELTSSNDITFLERALPNAFSPLRNTGLAVNGTLLDKRMTWAVGGFRNTDDFGNGFGEDSEYNVSARLTGVPWYGDEGRKLLHLGLGYSRQFRNNDAVSYSTKPEAHLAPDFLGTGDILSDGVSLINPELAVVAGPFSFQAEYMLAEVESSNGPDPDFDGFYLMASYFLTGEHRPYSLSNASFSRVKPKRNFARGAGPGAWELAVRYSNLDLDDNGVNGGQLDNITIGINWYLNPFARIMFNYIRSELDNVGDTNIFQTRFQVAF